MSFIELSLHGLLFLLCLSRVFALWRDVRQSEQKFSERVKNYWNFKPSVQNLSPYFEHELFSKAFYAGIPIKSPKNIIGRILDMQFEIQREYTDSVSLFLQKWVVLHSSLYLAFLMINSMTQERTYSFLYVFFICLSLITFLIPLRLTHCSRDKLGLLNDAGQLKSISREGFECLILGIRPTKNFLEATQFYESQLRQGELNLEVVNSLIVNKLLDEVRSAKTYWRCFHGFSFLLLFLSALPMMMLISTMVSFVFLV